MRVLCVLVAVLLLALPAVAEEQVELAWKLTKGQELELYHEISYTSDVALEIGSGELKDRQQSTANTTWRVVVVKAHPDGAADLGLQLTSAILMLRSRQMTLVATAMSGDADDVAVVCTVQAAQGGAADRKAVERVEACAKALMALPFEARIAASGEVLSTRVEGTPYGEDSLFESPLEEAAVLGLRDLFEPSELLQSAVAHTFQTLPSEPVVVGDSWSAMRRFPILGATARGTGTARLTEVRGDGAEQVAVIREDASYRVNLETWRARRTARMKMIATLTGLDIDADLDLEPTGPMRLVHVTEFATQPSQVNQAAFSDLSLEGTGEATVRMSGKAEQKKLTVRLTGQSKARLGPVVAELVEAADPPAPKLSPRDRAFEDALRWLAAHQSENGRWEAAGFGTWCNGSPDASGPGGVGDERYDVGVTGLALCAFLSAGYTNRGKHPYAKTVSKGLRYLKTQQDAEGCFGPRSNRHYWYGHAAAALAMVEAYGMTGSPIFRGSAQRGLEFMAVSRESGSGWGYASFKEGTPRDVSITVEMMMSLTSAKLIIQDAMRGGRLTPMKLDEKAFSEVPRFLASMTDATTGRCGYWTCGGSLARSDVKVLGESASDREYRPDVLRFPSYRSEALTAAALFTRIAAGEGPAQSPVLTKSVALCAAKPPRWDVEDASIDMYYWYWGSLALFQVGGEAWKTWNEHLEKALLPNQRKDGTYCGAKGSWDPVGAWGKVGGRVYSTAMMAMCLSAGWRYERVH